MGLPPWWLNDQASAYVEHDVGKREVFDHPGIRVMAASPEHVFAMKAFAARERDEDDLRALSEIVGISTIEAARGLCSRFLSGRRASGQIAGDARGFVCIVRTGSYGSVPYFQATR
jgi:hypothetical protein